ncbi:MAG: antibiotic biosynthesis monooxygenase [Candidatus Dormibacteraeota bacterium]|nr:antibiotic biosynthesis monooxygenase [Candidatus Dormibacteraeota bacterium]
MIARTWRGWTRLEDAEAYVRYVEDTGGKEYRQTPGNRGAWVLWRPDGDRAEILTFTLWESRQAIQAFAGDDIQVAKFYPEDDRWLVDRERFARHYEVAE